MTVDQYLEQLPEEKQATMYKVRNAIIEAAPKAEEVFSYNMPGYLYLGPLVYFSAYKHHYSLFGASKKILTDLREDLTAFKINGSTIQFTEENPLPVSLIKKIVKLRMRENESRSRGKQSKIRKTKARS